VTTYQDTLTLADVARLVRSKNAGPFWITIDIFFATDADYAAYHDDITADGVAAAYGVDESTVKIFGIPNLRVVKVSFPRPVPQGSAYDRDMHAGQQHVPMLSVPVRPRSPIV
jgi:hypothetical protein